MTHISKYGDLKFRVRNDKLIFKSHKTSCNADSFVGIIQKSLCRISCNFVLKYLKLIKDFR